MEPTAPVAEPPSNPTPVMDVVPPPTESEQLATPPAEEESDNSSKPTQDVEQAASKPTTIKSDKPRNSSVNSAIIATIIIVLGLAALATYAYIQTK